VCRRILRSDLRSVTVGGLGAHDGRAAPRSRSGITAAARPSLRTSSFLALMIHVVRLPTSGRTLSRNDRLATCARPPSSSPGSVGCLLLQGSASVQERLRAVDACLQSPERGMQDSRCGWLNGARQDPAACLGKLAAGGHARTAMTSPPALRPGRDLAAQGPTVNAARVSGERFSVCWDMNRGEPG
jgi:hypothetical protein